MAFLSRGQRDSHENFFDMLFFNIVLHGASECPVDFYWLDSNTNVLNQKRKSKMSEWLVLAHATQARVYDLSKKNLKDRKSTRLNSSH